MKQPRLKILYLFLSLFFLIMFHVHAQKYVIDVVQLKNGDVYKGIILEQPDTGFLRIETLCRNIMNFNMNDVLSVTSEKFKPWTAALPYAFEPKGYVNITDLGMLIGTGNNNQNAIFSVSSFNGYGFSSRYLVGGGIGVEFFETLMLPLYIESRCIVSRNKLSPYLNLKAGYSFSLEDPVSYWGESYNSTGGYLYGTGIGAMIWINNRNAIEINIQYRYQDIKTIRTIEWSDQTTTITTKYNRLELKLGLLFQ
jgi:hypothetical protein